MKTDHLINRIFPFTAEDRKCRMKKEKKTWQREKFRGMIQKYYQGEAVNFKSLYIDPEQIQLILHILQDHDSHSNK
jgi:hypothetical protein